MPSTCKATHSLLNSTPSTPQSGQFGGSAGVCVHLCVAASVLDCLDCPRVHAGMQPLCMCMYVHEILGLCCGGEGGVGGGGSEESEGVKRGSAVGGGGRLLFGWA